MGPNMADTKLLEVFPNPAPKRDYVIEHTHHEFTSMCPITGHPDFGAITVRYVAGKKCVELKSLKLYFHAFRNKGIFFEAVTNAICDDLGKLLRPRSLTVITDWKGRGGVTSVIIGPRTFDQFQQNMEGFDVQLDPAVVKRLSDATRWAR